MKLSIVQHKMFGVGMGIGMIGDKRRGFSLHIPFVTVQLLF